MTISVKGSTPHLTARVLSATVVADGDLLYKDPSTGDAKPFSSQDDNGDEESNQAEAKVNFLGISATSSPAGETRDLTVLADPAVAFDVTVPSATYSKGDLLGASENSGGDGLESQQMELVTSHDLAIAEVVGDVTILSDGSGNVTTRGVQGKVTRPRG